MCGGKNWSALRAPIWNKATRCFPSRVGLTYNQPQKRLDVFGGGLIISSGQKTTG